jgi:predicted Zn-dependent protease with MMP-like domain
MKIKHKSRLKKQKRQKKPGATNKKQERSLILKEVSETGEYEIQKKSSSSAEITKKVSFPKTSEELYKKTPEEFRNVMTAIDVYNYETRKVEVHSDSLESFLGYDSLMRLMGKYFGQQVAYYHSAEGGSLSIEQAHKEVYRK